MVLMAAAMLSLSTRSARLRHGVEDELLDRLHILSDRRLSTRWRRTSGAGRFPDRAGQVFAQARIDQGLAQLGGGRADQHLLEDRQAQGELRVAASGSSQLTVTKAFASCWSSAIS
jgi:hypothetical protein